VHHDVFDKMDLEENIKVTVSFTFLRLNSNKSLFSFNTNLNGGSLGSLFDEEHSKMCYFGKNRKICLPSSPTQKAVSTSVVDRV